MQLIKNFFRIGVLMSLMSLNNACKNNASDRQGMGEKPDNIPIEVGSSVEEFAKQPDEFSGTYSYIHHKSGKENLIFVRKTQYAYEIRLGEEPFKTALNKENRLILKDDGGAEERQGGVVLKLPSVLVIEKSGEQHKGFIAVENMDTIFLDLKKKH